MRDIQFIGGNNNLIQERIVKSCINSCDDGCDGDRLITMSIPAKAILLSLSHIGDNLEADAPVALTIGIKDNDTLIAEESATVVNDTMTTVELDNVSVGAESVVFTATPKTFPIKGSMCFMVKYLDMSQSVGVVNAVIPNLCSDECGCD